MADGVSGHKTTLANATAKALEDDPYVIKMTIGSYLPDDSTDTFFSKKIATGLPLAISNDD